MAPAGASREGLLSCAAANPCLLQLHCTCACAPRQLAVPPAGYRATAHDESEAVDDWDAQGSAKGQSAGSQPQSCIARISPLPGPPVVNNIVANEAAERFSYYSMRALLTLYMTDKLGFAPHTG